MGKRESGDPSDSMSWTSTLATTSAEFPVRPSDTSRISNFNRREATVQHCVGELVEDTGVFPGVAPLDQIQLLGGRATAASGQSVQHGPANASGGGQRSGLRCRLSNLSDGRTSTGGEVSGEAWSSSLETPPEARAPPQLRRCSRLRVRRRCIQRPSVRRTHRTGSAFIAESCDSFQPALIDRT